MNLSAQTTLKNFSNWIWIWKIQTEVEKYGSIDAVIAQLKQLGIHNVCIKFHEGASPIGGGVDYRAAYYQYKDAFKKAGFTVGTWGYNYFNDLPAEEGLIDEAIKNSDYYIFDPEADTSGKTAQAKTILVNLRKKHPKYLIGYSTFPIASFHKDIAYKVFDRYCDFASPQIYWGELTWGAEDSSHPYPTLYIQWRMGLPITGVYDDAMKAAITAYQTTGGITATGVVGQAMWTALWPPQPLAETPVK